jgi:hypothetical protein
MGNLPIFLLTYDGLYQKQITLAKISIPKNSIGLLLKAVEMTHDEPLRKLLKCILKNKINII